MEEIWLALQAEPQWIALIVVAILAVGGAGFALGRRGASPQLPEDDDGPSELLPALPERPARPAAKPQPAEPSVLDRFRRGLARTLGANARASRA